MKKIIKQKTPKQQARARSTQALKRARTEHGELARQVQATQAELEERTRKLHVAESDIAQLEREAYRPEAAESRPAPEDDKNLRPARLIYNSQSGGKAKNAHTLDEIVAVLRAHGIRAEFQVETSDQEARERAKEAANKNEALVIAVGGDGTIENVASQLVGTRTVLGILPIGTMNNVARSLGIPLDLDDACALLGAGTTRQIDVGRVIADEKPQVEYFLETAGLGLSALAFRAGIAAKKGWLSALPQMLRDLFDYQPSRMEIEFDEGETIQVNSQLVTVSNAPLTVLNFLIAPEARMDDGLLDIAVYDGMSKIELLDYFRALSNGKHADNPRVKFYRSRRVRIRSLQPAPVVSDEDAVKDQKVLKIEVIPGGLTMVVGNGIGLNLPVEAVPSVPPLSGPQPQTANGNGDGHQPTRVESSPNQDDSNRP